MEDCGFPRMNSTDTTRTTAEFGVLEWIPGLKSETWGTRQDSENSVRREAGVFNPRIKPQNRRGLQPRIGLEHFLYICRPPMQCLNHAEAFSGVI
jgi:hypothetical protein